MNVYELVTERIMKKLEQGVIPWRQPWVNSSAAAVNWRTQKAYRGINAFLLEPGEYATLKQINEAGGKVIKGSKGNIVVYWNWQEKEDKETGAIARIPFLRYYTVFNVLTQAEGLESKRITVNYEHTPIEEAECIINEYQNAPKIRKVSGRAFYRSSEDIISVPPMEDYKISEEYYSTLFHEMIHSTGHTSRIGRPGIIEAHFFGDETYSKEELIAELGASMLCAQSRIDNQTIDNSASYIHSWLRALKDDKRLIITAASQAQKAVDFILSSTHDQEPVFEG